MPTLANPKGRQLGKQGGNGRQCERQAQLRRREKPGQHQGGTHKPERQPEVGNDGVTQPLPLNDTQTVKW